MLFRSCNRTNGAVVNFTATATDLGDSNVTVICTPPSGSVFPLGNNTVVCTAFDHSGNTNSCSFNISVVEISPVLGIKRQNQNVVIFWQDSCNPYVLEEAFSVIPPVIWTLAAPSFVDTNFINNLVVPMTNSTQMFYRLRYP